MINSFLRNFQAKFSDSLGAQANALMLWAMAIGLFILISGKVWLFSSSARNSQVYIWLLAPALIYAVSNFRSWPSLKHSPEIGVWVIFLVWVGVSTFWNVNSEVGDFSLAKRGIFIFLYLSAIYIMLAKGGVFFHRALLAGVLVVALGAAASLVYQYGVLGKPLAYRGFRIDRMGLGEVANYGWPVAAGIFHGAIATWVLSYSLSKDTRWNWAVVGFLVFIVLVAYVVMTGTRGAWSALFVSIIVVVMMQRPRIAKIIISVFAIVSVIVLYCMWDKVLFEIQDRQLSGRGGIWRYYLQVMSGHWLFGFGLGTPFEYLWPNGKSVSPHAHSLYLQQVYDSGLIALALLLAGLGCVVKKAWQLRGHPWVRLAFPALVFSLVAMLTDVERIFTRPGDYWVVFWLPLGVLLSIRR
ncbi:O-antigen ligase family protein [Pseudomonas juntendi]|uniref:O-antigen ligase family protein n=1 Tax=Pseudomonas TaxID=286 RepID=UPI0034D6A685